MHLNLADEMGTPCVSPLFTNHSEIPLTTIPPSGKDDGPGEGRSMRTGKGAPMNVLRGNYSTRIFFSRIYTFKQEIYTSDV